MVAPAVRSQLIRARPVDPARPHTPPPWRGSSRIERSPRRCRRGRRDRPAARRRRATSGRAPAVGGDDRHAERHRFEHRQAEALLERRLHQQPGAFVQARAAAAARRSRCGARADRAAHAAMRSSHGPDCSVALPASTQRRNRDGVRASSRFVRVEQRADVLARLERAEEQRRSRPGAASSAAARPGAPGEQTEIRCARHVEQPLDFAGGELRDDDHAVGPVGVAPGQRGVVPPDFGPRPLGMREEVEIVDGDDLGARRAGISSGCSECVTSTGACVRASAGGHPSRCQARLSRRTGIRRSTAVAPRPDPGRPLSRSFRGAREDRHVQRTASPDRCARRQGEHATS